MRINVLLLFVGVGCFAGSVLAIQLQHPKRLQTPEDSTEARLKQLSASLRSALQSFKLFVLKYGTELSANRWFDLPPVWLVGAGWVVSR